MATAPNRRLVKTLCSAKQYSLFEECAVEPPGEPITQSISAEPLVRFEAPDPSGLSINGKPLHEHLEQAGLSIPLKLRPLLQSLSFAEFEAGYRPGGRPPAKTSRQGQGSGQDPSAKQRTEAVLQPQKHSKDFRGSYKPTVLANNARVIVACDVHPSSETAVVPGLLDRAQALGPLETALFDAGFFSDGILDAAARRDIELLCPEGQSQGDDWNKQANKRIPKSRFIYQADDDTYLCPNQQHLTRRHSCQGGQTGRAYTLYGCDACSGCPLKPQGTRSESGRTLKRYDRDSQKEALRLKMSQPEHRQRYRQRQTMVEPVFSQLRGRQGLNRFRRKGLAGVQVEFALHAMAYNLSRALVVGLLSTFYHWFRAIVETFERNFTFWRRWLTSYNFGGIRQNTKWL